ncbi:MAG: hypothetical protein KF823_02830 [Xanthomonadales bacterium]|nr:hypothetical protein [Xanthomonadales bacterium]
MNDGHWQARAGWLIGRAILAPSSHNTQPWRFRVSPSSIELRADCRYALPVNDPAGRELVISCACALTNLRIAAAGRGLAIRVALLPETDDPDLLARVTIDDGAATDLDEEGLAGYIQDRHTWRRRFAPDPVDGTVVQALLDAAASEGTRLQPLVGESIRRDIATIAAC